MDEGLTRLVASLPTDEAESKGETWSAFQLMAASKARLLNLTAVLPCHVSHTCGMSVYELVIDELCIRFCTASIRRLSKAYRANMATLPCATGVQVKRCWCAGKEAVTQGKKSLAAKLAALQVWLSLTLDAETFPSTGKQVLAEPLVCDLYVGKCWLQCNHHNC